MHRNGYWGRAGMRLWDLETVFDARYGPELPDDDAGRDDLFLAAHAIAALGGDIIGHIIAWQRMRAPWLSDAEAEALAARTEAKRYRFKADTLAERLGMTKAERDRLGLTTIGAIDCNAEERKALRRKRKAAAKKEQPPHRRYEAASRIPCGEHHQPHQAVGGRRHIPQQMV